MLALRSDPVRADLDKHGAGSTWAACNANYNEGWHERISAARHADERSRRRCTLLPFGTLAESGA
jgi:hypothetical protein